MSFNIPTQYSKQEYHINVVRPIIAMTESILGAPRIKEILFDLGVSRDYFNDKHNWISMSFMDDFFKALEHYGIDPRQLMYDAGRSSMSKQELGFAYYIFSKFPTFSSILKVVATVAERVNKVVAAKYIARGKNEGIVELTDLRPLEEMHDSRCDSWRGTLDGASRFYLGESGAAKITEISCRFRGDDKCRFLVKWTANRQTSLVSALLLGIVFVALGYWLFSANPLFIFIQATIALLLLNLFLAYSIFTKNKQIAEMRMELVRHSKEVEKNFQDFHQQRETSLENQLKANKAFIEKLKRVSQSVAHEVNNPLAIISGNVGLIENQIKSGKPIDDAKIASCLGKIKTGVKRANFISNALYLYSGQKGPEAKSAVKRDSIEPCVRELLERKQIDYSFVNISPRTFVASNYLIEISVEDLITVLDAIINNAEFSIKEKLQKDPTFVAKLFMEYKIEGDSLHIFFTDNGLGFTEEALEKGLDLFYTTKEVGQGQGLGLNVIEGVVRGAGGSVHLSNSEVHGAVVQLELPRKLKLD